MSAAHDLLKSLWGDTGLRLLMRPDQVRRIESYFASPAGTPLPARRFVHVDSFVSGSDYVEFAAGEWKGRACRDGNPCGPYMRTRAEAEALVAQGLWRELVTPEDLAPAAPAITQPELTVWYGPMPESNGKSNFTAVLYHKGVEGFDIFTDGFTIDRSEYPDRVRYEADRVRWLIGERAERPEMWDKGYDFDKHSGYVEPDRSAPAEQQSAPAAQQDAPIPMILNCPKCGLQHIDAPEWEDDPHDIEHGQMRTWTNPPHRSHLCHGCGNIWRPADVATNGVKAIQTRGSNDSAPTAQQSAQAERAAGDLAERVKSKVMGRLELRGLLTDITHNNLRILGYELLDDLRGVLTVAPEMRLTPNVKAMVDRFLGWPLPKDFYPDCGISFDGRKDDEWSKGKTWPTGTNLLHAGQAKAMFEYVLAAPVAQEVEQPHNPVPVRELLIEMGNGVAGLHLQEFGKCLNVERWAHIADSVLAARTPVMPTTAEQPHMAGAARQGGDTSEGIGKLRSTLYAIANTLDDGELRSAAKAAYDLDSAAIRSTAADSPTNNQGGV